jgi:hypothetical protein
MNVGDFIKASWSDGMVCFGYYEREERGYVILSSKEGDQIVCNKSLVKLELLPSCDEQTEAVSG